MNPVEINRSIENVFYRVRKQFKLGIDELQAALDAIANHRLCSDADSIEGILQLLWCQNWDDREIVAARWQEELETAKQARASKREEPEKFEPDSSFASDEPIDRTAETTRSEQQQPEPNAPIVNRLAPLPLQVPPQLDTDEEDIRNEFPVTRRSLSYGWRSLRRLRADGALDVVDVEGTIQQVARQGFYLAPVLKRREVNHARLLLFVDRQGSMVPFHRFTRELVETAREDASLETVQVYYFYNVPQQYVYTDEHLTQPIELARVLADCDRQTSAIVVSDAGAARGNRRLERIRETTKFLVELRSYTELIGWLNPVPKVRWQATTAEILAYLVRMETMSQDGFSTTIDVMRRGNK